MITGLGELLIVGFSGISAEEEWPRKIQSQLERGELGGIILFRFNIIDRPQLTAMLSAITSSSSNPPIVMVDQEGGKVQRLSPVNGFPDWPSAKAVAASLSLEEAEETSFAMARILREVGINFNCAPCVDCDFEPPSPPIGKVERSYGADPDMVTRYAAAFVRGHRRAGVVSCAKHFPGHGSAQGDTHQGLVDITSTWSDSELSPYRSLLEKGLLDSVMVAHLVHAEVDPGVPAVFSANWSKRLRGDIGFDGIVVSDDLHMGAIQQHYSFDEVVAGAFNGGSDLLVYSNNPLAAKGVEGFVPDPQLPQKFKESVERLVNSGVIPSRRIEKSIERVLALKARM